MSQFFTIHPENPQQRLIQQACQIINKGGVIAYPTDSAYALGCHIGDKKAVEKIRSIRQLSSKHNLTLMCLDLADISTYAKVDNSSYRQLKAHTPGPYTFILEATRQVPRLLLHPKRRTVGIRVPGHAIVRALLAHLDSPLLSSTLILPEQSFPMADPWEIRQALEHCVDLIIDSGEMSAEPTTVVDLREESFSIMRQGKGEISSFIEAGADCSQLDLA